MNEDSLCLEQCLALATHSVKGYGMNEGVLISVWRGEKVVELLKEDPGNPGKPLESCSCSAWVRPSHTGADCRLS